MKCCGMQYVSAIKYFKRKNIVFKRTIHLVFVPEEELGGNGGMADFVHTQEFRALNPGFSLDEGIASPTNVFNVFYAERTIWHIIFKINGNNGHGALLLKDTAPERLRTLLNFFYDYRDTQVKKLLDNPDLTIGDVTTVNITMINGGVQLNTVPPDIKIMTDMRLAVDVNHEEFENMVKGWCEQAGDVEYEFDLKDPFIAPTKIDESNNFWQGFKSAVSEL
jgi:aminoacylase